MLGFVVPIKPKCTSKDWEYDNRLFERTARSICAQTISNFKLFVVHNERPAISFEHQNIIYLQYPHPHVKPEQIEDVEYVKKYYSFDYAEKMMDKGKKILFGCKLAKEHGCKYIMAVDSDDLISRSLAAHVESAEGRPPGWRIKKGYVYCEGSRIVVRNHAIYGLNGSTHIVRENLIHIPEFSTNRLWDYNLFESHGYTYGRLRDFHKEILVDLPFYGVVYVAHKNNVSKIAEIRSARSIKNACRILLMGRFLTDSIRLQFSLYRL